MKVTSSSVILLSATVASAAGGERDGWGGPGGFWLWRFMLGCSPSTHLFSSSLPNTNDRTPASPLTYLSPSRLSVQWRLPTTLHKLRLTQTPSLLYVVTHSQQQRQPLSPALQHLALAHTVVLGTHVMPPRSARRTSCASATASDAACTGWYGYGQGGGMGGWGGHGGPGGHGGCHGGNNNGNGHSGGRWGQSKGPDGYCRVGPNGTCADGLVTSTAVVTSTLTDAQGVVQTTVGQETRIGTVVRLEEVDIEETSTVGVPIATQPGAAGHVGVKAGAALAGLAVGVVAVL